MMRSTIVCGLVVGGVLAGAALAAEQRPVEPGGKIGAMTVVRGNSYDADEVVWIVGCNGLISKPGKYHWSCVLPKVPRLYIGASDFRRTQKERDSVWKHEQWRLWVDGRPVDLSRFGSSDSYQRNRFNGKSAFVRSWKVILAHAPSGKHTIRYLWRSSSGGAADLTMTVTVT